MATVAAPDVENPSTSPDVNSKTPTGEDASTTPPLAAPDGGGGSGSESNDKPAVVSVYARDDDGGGAVTDIQKKMKRAERFGMPAQLSEEEKRNSRAERFRTATAVNGSDSSKPSEELKKKARAERFGIVQSEPNDGEAKKKARLARFGSSKLDPVEEEKKKARAIRFSQPAYGLNASGKGDIEFQKTASTGKADGETKCND